MDAKQTINLAVVYPAGPLSMPQKAKETRYEEFQERGVSVFDLVPQATSLDGCTSSPVLERVTQVSYALTMRKFPLIMSARGGVGTTELVPYLENCLPPVIPDKIFVGYSDNSFLGVYLACRYPNFIYVHGPHFFEGNLFEHSETEIKTLFDIFQGKKNSFSFPTRIIQPKWAASPLEEKKIEGVCVPLNLSLAESLSACSFLSLPKNNILFLEDCHEYRYRILRKIDSLLNSGLLKQTNAIVLGCFNDCLNGDESPLSREDLIQLFSEKTNLPIVDLPLFGHAGLQFPLVMKSSVAIQCGSNPKIYLSHFYEKSSSLSTSFSPHLFSYDSVSQERVKVHFTGIGGSGMAQVAGFFQEAGFEISGSDDPIYPPMDKLIKQLNVTPDVGYLYENIEKHNPDFIVLANVVSRLSGSLKKNAELDGILNQRKPVLSFPSALRKYFLHSSRNVVISGTHGKTTTSSLVTFLLTELKFNPSFLIGGSPVNFKAGFALNSPNLFVLEGDEYDSALFDKGPKFLHYEPKITLINNIEFDHADIYENVHMIENEFFRLAQLTCDKQGYLVVNCDDDRVMNVISQFQHHKEKIVGFTSKKQFSYEFPIWQLIKLETISSGSRLTVQTPQGKIISIQTQVFGHHNALNCLAALAVLQCNALLDQEEKGSVLSQEAPYFFLENALEALTRFRGVKRRFELLAYKNEVSVFDDFAHHPTAVSTTLQAFRDYMISSQKSGKLIVCFDPRNATMRRNILQEQLIESFTQADVLFLGKVFQDLRLKSTELLNGSEVVKRSGKPGQYFEDNEILLKTLNETVAKGDTVVFMSAGAFDGIPHKFADMIASKEFV